MNTRLIDVLIELRPRLVLPALLAVFAALGCAGEGEPVEGPFVSPALDSARQQSAVIGPKGGEVSATAADGSVYTLAIPADALAEDTEISLTPVRSIDELPMSGGLIDAVHFEPSGLQLLRGAVLVVEMANAPVLSGDEMFVGFTYDHEGENLDLVLPEVDGSTFFLPIHHFSGGGAGAATPDDLAAAYPPGTSDAFIAELSAALPSDDTATFESIVRRWYAAVVKPELKAAVASDAALERAVDTLARWHDSQLILGIQLDDLIPESRALAAAALGDAVGRANDLCARQRSFAHAEKVIAWHKRAEDLVPNGLLLEHGLDRESIVIDLCVQVAYESTSYPADPIAGEPEPLQIVVGYAFGTGPIELDAGMVVEVLGIGALPFGTSTATDENGLVALAMTPEGGNLRIEVDACIGNVPGAGPLVGALACQDAFIVRGPDDDVNNPDDPGNPDVSVDGSGFPATALWNGGIVSQRSNGTEFSREAELRTSYDPSTGTLTARSCESTDCIGDSVGCDALWEGTVSGTTLSMTMVNHTNACAIGRPGQNRLYGCTLTASMSTDPDGTVRLVGSGDGGFFSCGLGSSFEVCMGGCPE